MSLLFFFGNPSEPDTVVPLTFVDATDVNPLPAGVLVTLSRPGLGSPQAGTFTIPAGRHTLDVTWSAGATSQTGTSKFTLFPWMPYNAGVLSSATADALTFTFSCYDALY